MQRYVNNSIERWPRGRRDVYIIIMEKKLVKRPAVIKDYYYYY